MPLWSFPKHSEKSMCTVKVKSILKGPDSACSRLDFILCDNDFSLSFSLVKKDDIKFRTTEKQFKLRRKEKCTLNSYLVYKTVDKFFFFRELFFYIGILIIMFSLVYRQSSVSIEHCHILHGRPYLFSKNRKTKQALSAGFYILSLHSLKALLSTRKKMGKQLVAISNLIIRLNPTDGPFKIHFIRFY